MYTDVFSPPRIDSEHNRCVVEEIVREIGTEKYTSTLIRGLPAHLSLHCKTMSMYFYFYLCVEGCRIYRKTLHEKDRDRSSAEKQRIRLRARQQRVR